jgi:hypothetical protein
MIGFLVGWFGYKWALTASKKAEEKEDFTYEELPCGSSEHTIHI